MKHTGTLRRFGTREANPADVRALGPDHAALQGAGRTLFPSTVVGSLASPRFLVSGHNNPKLGKEVIKGPRAGWPIFHLTLEERATCPRSCEQWASCYGNAMPQARRHAVDAEFLPLLVAEVATLARANPKGVLIRLHALGDFYSPTYVMAWAELLAKFPQIAVFGYTARRTDDADPESARIARTIKVLTDAMWDRFAIRTSSSAPVARSRAIVVLADPEEPDTIVCPAQTGATEACATCGLCWSEAARDKTIAFLLHGMTSVRGPRAPKPELTLVETPAAATAAPPPKAPATRSRAQPGELNGTAIRALAGFRSLADKDGLVSAPRPDIARAGGFTMGSWQNVTDALKAKGLLELVKAGKGGYYPSTYRVALDGALPVTTLAAKAPGPAPAIEPRGPWLEARPQPSARSRHPEPEPASVPARAPASRTDPAAFDLPVEPHDGPVTLLNLRVNDCHWQMGAPDPIQRYCGKPVSGTKAYCGKHLAAMYQGKRS